MRKRLRKKNGEKVDEHIAYCKHFGLPVILDESSVFKKKHWHAMKRINAILSQSLAGQFMRVSQPPWWSALVHGEHVPIRRVLGDG